MRDSPFTDLYCWSLIRRATPSPRKWQETERSNWRPVKPWSLAVSPFVLLFSHFSCIENCSELFVILLFYRINRLLQRLPLNVENCCSLWLMDTRMINAVSASPLPRQNIVFPRSHWACVKSSTSTMKTVREFWDSSTQNTNIPACEE